MSLFKKTLPFTLTVFINKCGSIGLNLIPMLLIEKSLSLNESGLVMATIKTTSLFGTFLGGFLCDHIGMKITILLSFLFSAIGLGSLPFVTGMFFIIVLCSIAQLGNSLFNGPMRLLIISNVKPEEQQVAWGLYRMANNAGQIISFGIGIFFSGLGINGLMFFDSMTSILATIIGAKKIKSHDEFLEKKKDSDNIKADIKLFLLFSLVTGGVSFLYDMYMVALAANAKIYFGYQGLKIYSQIMMVNTVICTIVAIPASKKIKNPKLAIPLGILFMGIGSVISYHATYHLWQLYLGEFFLTIGEIFYTAVSTFVLIRITPEVKRKGSIFGLGLVFQPIGRIIGAGLAFPYIVQGKLTIIIPMFVAIALILLTGFVLKKTSPEKIQWP